MVEGRGPLNLPPLSWTAECRVGGAKGGSRCVVDVCDGPPNAKKLEPVRRPYWQRHAKLCPIRSRLKPESMSPISTNSLGRSLAIFKVVVIQIHIHMSISSTTARFCCPRQLRDGADWQAGIKAAAKQTGTKGRAVGQWVAIQQLWDV